MFVSAELTSSLKRALRILAAIEDILVALRRPHPPNYSADLASSNECAAKDEVDDGGVVHLGIETDRGSERHTVIARSCNARRTMMSQQKMTHGAGEDELVDDCLDDGT